MTDEAGLDDVMSKPLSDNIIDGMAADDTERKNVLVIMYDMSAMQANLVGRMLKTLKVESDFIDMDALEQSNEA